MTFRLALALALLAAVFPSRAAVPVDGDFIVSFSEPPLAAFRGFAGDADPRRASLKATSPAVTGDAQLDVSSPQARAYRAYLADRREQRLAEISAALGRLVTPSLSLDVVNNAVVLGLSADEAARVAKLPGIAVVEPEFFRRPMTDAGPQWIGADQLWSGVDGIATRGAGVVVGVIDSGINRTHPSFAAVGPIDGHAHTNPRGQFYGLCASNAALCNAKLIGIHDFTVCTGVHASSSCDDREPNTGLDPDGHGSHVASTVAGNRVNTSLTVATGSVTRTLSGVAPHANLISYKACEEEETCRGSWLLAALNKAVEENVAVINFSIGGSPRDPWSSGDSQAMLNAREAGVVVVVSAGNSGPGDGSVTGPADAPWVIAAANATHDRAIVNRLVDLSGGNTAPPEGGVLLGVGSTGAYGPAPLLVPTDFPACSIGSDIDFPVTGASNPWTGQVFNGQIVVCARGVQARVAKSNNVRLAGGGGMVLTNTFSDGESVVADAHSIPGTHLGFSSGQALRQWLATGSGHTGRIEGAQVRNEAALADVLASSSGRGPVATAGILKPTISAPGTSVLAAAGTGNGTAFLTGTSMAAPHIAGAAALLRAARPDWNVSDIESALMSTARPVVRSSDGSRLARPFEQGAGRIDVPQALRAGLGFRVSPQDFRNARPSLGGRPETLNQPTFVHPSCFERCTLTRTVRDLVGGASWRVEADLPPGARIEAVPAEFTLGAGQSRSVSLTLVVDDPRLAGQWVDGRIMLRRTGGAPAADAAITVNAFADPGSFPPQTTLSIDSDRGFQDHGFSGLVALPDLDLTATRLVEPTVRVENVVEDPTNTEVYDSFGTGTFFSLVEIPASATPRRYRLLADLRSPTAIDVDLFVGVDSNGNLQPERSEERCRSTSPVAVERCELTIEAGPVTQVYWVLAQNWRASSSGASNPLRLETALIELAPTPAGDFTVTGPGRAQAGELVTLRHAVDVPDMAPGATRYGYVGWRAVSDAPEALRWQLVEVQRGGSTQPAARALAPGRPLDLRLAAGAAAERLFIDVPANASALTFSSVTGGEIDLYAAHVANPSTPVIAVAPPRAQAQVSAVGPGGNHSLRIEGAALQSGRWYLTPVNTGPGSVLVQLQVQLEHAGPRAAPRFGAYFDPSRDGSGLFLFPVGEVWGLAWYAYLQDGSATWYLGVAPRPGAQQGHWQVDLLRYRWNGSAAIGTQVGEALLALNGSNEFGFSWSLDGQSGSQRMQWIGDANCPSVSGAALDVNGLWFSPERPGFGYSVIAGPGFESIGAYYYDVQGRPRWALGQVAPFGANQLPLAVRQGSCPLCDYAAPTFALSSGTLTRTYAGPGSGHFRTDIRVNPNPAAPVAGDWLIDLPAVKLSDAIGCP